MEKKKRLVQFQLLSWQLFWRPGSKPKGAWKKKMPQFLQFNLSHQVLANHQVEFCCVVDRQAMSYLQNWLFVCFCFVCWLDVPIFCLN